MVTRTEEVIVKEKNESHVESVNVSGMGPKDSPIRDELLTLTFFLVNGSLFFLVGAIALMRYYFSEPTPDLYLTYLTTFTTGIVATSLAMLAIIRGKRAKDTIDGIEANQVYKCIRVAAPALCALSAPIAIMSLYFLCLLSS